MSSKWPKANLVPLGENHIALLELNTSSERTKTKGNDEKQEKTDGCVYRIKFHKSHETNFCRVLG